MVASCAGFIGVSPYRSPPPRPIRRAPSLDLWPSLILTWPAMIVVLYFEWILVCFRILRPVRPEHSMGRTIAACVLTVVLAWAIGVLWGALIAR